MHSSTLTADLATSSLPAGGASERQFFGAIGAGALLCAGVVGFAAGDGLKSVSYAYLVSFAFFLSISLGALFFVLIQHITRAGWSVVVRRIAELLACGVAPLAILFLPILLPVLAGSSPLYEWNDADVVAGNALLQKKTPYLNASFFTVRWVIYFAAWSLISWRLLAWSRRQDAEQGNGVDWAGRLEQFSCPMAFVAALTLTFASIDLLMSLAPEWFSSIYGVYYFAGAMVSSLATMTITVMWLQNRGLLKQVTVEHQHDLGKLLFGFNCFWAYIAFSQYLLIWYSNIPEETQWYKIRQENGWQYVSILLIAGHFAIPFLGFMSRYVKRNSTGLTFWAVWLLVMHYIDLYWLAVPQQSPEGPVFGFSLVLCLLGIGGLYLAGVLWLAGDRPLLAHGDPRLPESLEFHNI
jgi:hypothetical protein